MPVKLHTFLSYQYIREVSEDKYVDTGICAEDYSGNACSRCTTNFAKFGETKECVDCRVDNWYYIKFSIAILT